MNISHFAISQESGSDVPHRRAVRRTLLILSQVVIPDPASVGQHVADVAMEMARRGYRVVVYTSRRGYEDPTRRYPPRERIGGVEVRRLPLASFGKRSMLSRVLGTASFMIQAMFASLFTPNVRGIFFSTSPPLIGMVASIAGMLRSIPVAYWAMDLNPDQLIALGKLKPTDMAARLLESANRFILRQASLIVALDRFMAARLERRGRLAGKLLVLPPWPHEDHIEPSSGVSPFRLKHGLQGKFVVMYSGNHSPSNPLTTLLRATLRFRDDADLRFLFVGGGTGKQEVESFIRQNNLTNVLCLPYQPLAELGDSLSAADVHVVSLGEGMVGIIHPCKIYGAMAVAKPILFLGPSPSHIGDLLNQHGIGWRVPQGDVAAAEAQIIAARQTPGPVLQQMGLRAQHVLRATLSQENLCAQFCDALEAALNRSRRSVE
jgi:colanic acid biosynthesis glycosyl transferase WcaI